MEPRPPTPHDDLTLFQRPDQLPYPLYVVTTVFNSPRYRSRWRLYEDFAKMVAEAGAILYTVEIAFGDRAFAVTEPGNPRHIQLRTTTELWYKELAINIGVSHLPADWKCVAWVDADVQFARVDWANETLHRLQHYAAIQMWSMYQDMTSEHELIGTARSFMDGYLTNWAGWHGVPGRPDPNGPPPPPYPYPGGALLYPGGAGIGKQYPGAPGLAWAMRRDAWDTIGGLLDFSILGAGDWIMAWAMVGMLTSDVVSAKWSPRYQEKMFQWQTLAQGLHKNIGVMPGLAIHYYHGNKVDRKYGTREQILTKTQFNPDTDLRKDWQGLWQLNVHDNRTIMLRDLIRQYFHSLNEDTVSVPR